MACAAVAAAEGLRVQQLEHAAVVGGTTAISGGMVWVPGNALMQPPDHLQAARDYLAATVPPGLDPVLLDTFVSRGGELLQHLQARTGLQLQPVARYPDYEPDRPGATLGGRVLEAVPFDARVLGPDFARLRPPLPEFTAFGGMMIARADLPHFRRLTRSPASAWRVAQLLLRHARERLHAPRGTTLVLGNALAARLLQAVLRLGVQLRTGCGVRALWVEQGRVLGVQLHDGQRLRAARGVVLACGGLSHDPGLRARCVPAAAADSATVDTGAPASGAALALAAGAVLADHRHAQGLWVPVSRFRRADGSAGVFPHTVTDRGKPGLIAVDGRGRRFVNEALSYHAFGCAQLDQGAVPAWLLCDRRFLWRYGLGLVRPFTRRLQRFIDSGYLSCGADWPALASAIGVPAAALAGTVQRFNAGAQRGEDPDFGRGGDAYQRHLGDADHGPNPCVAPLVQAPFFAVAVWPADLGMAAGLATDALGRVRQASGQVLPGLYACGNDMQSVMNGAYPGPGITLGPALVFGTLVARDAAGLEA